MLTTVDQVRFYITAIEREFQVRLNRELTDDDIISLIWMQSEVFDSRALTTYTRRERRFRFDGTDQFEQSLPAYPVKKLYWLKVYIGTAGLMWEFKDHEIIYTDKDLILRPPELSPSAELYIDRLSGRMVVPIFWMFIAPQTTTYFPYSTFGGVVSYLGYAKRFVGGPFTLEAYGLFGFHVEDEEPLLRPPLDVQQAVAKMVAIELAKVASTAMGGLSSWSLGERSEPYAGGAPFAWIVEQWQKDIDAVIQRHYNWSGYNITLGSGAHD